MLSKHASHVWDTSATLIDVYIENVINMCSVWTAWAQFWGRQHVFLQYCEWAALHAVASTGLAKKVLTNIRNFWQPYKLQHQQYSHSRKRKSAQTAINMNRTFDAGQVDAGVLVDPDAVPNDPERAFLKRSGARHQLQEHTHELMTHTESGLFWTAVMRRLLSPDPVLVSPGPPHTCPL